MSDEQQKRNARSDITRADQASQLLSNPLYLEAIEVMTVSMFAEFRDSKCAEVDTRHELWQRMQLMKQFQSRFESIIKQGGKAEDTIKMIDAKPDNGLR
tara:strand:- start:1083 stop:1379 length:297 start_codon:yes stop_codon:yes gene_type:complete